MQLRMLTCSRDTQVDKDFNVKIADFGLARLKAHVMTGNLGTCQYMAPGNIFPPSLHCGRGPRCHVCVSCAESLACVVVNAEVLRNESYTESADVYSFGIIVWEIVARAPPFHGMQTMQIAYSVNQGMRPPIPSHCPLVRLPPPPPHLPFLFCWLYESPDLTFVGLAQPLRDLMQRCWNQDPRLRPSFTAILNQIKGIKL